MGQRHELDEYQEVISSSSSNKLIYKTLHWDQPSQMSARVKKSRPEAPTNYKVDLAPINWEHAPLTIGNRKLTRGQYRFMAYQYYTQIPEAIQNLA